VALAKDNGAAVATHETGHLIEEANHRWGEVIHRFFSTRIDDDLRSLQGQIRAKHLKSPSWVEKARAARVSINTGSEQGWADKFYSPYCGRAYAGSGTEITSMGLQALYENPMMLARADVI
jgi:hypothetical protein